MAFAFDDLDPPDDAATPTITLEYPEWHLRAACRAAPRALFFTDRSWDDATRTWDDGTAAAKTVCATCCVRPECLASALAIPFADDYGVLGGTSRGERQLIRAQTATGRAAVACGASPRTRNAGRHAERADAATAAAAAI